MYNIVNWDTDEIITSTEKLSTAKRLCRQQGHTGDGNGDYYSPVALVRDENGCCVYNPKFTVGKHDHLKAETFTIVARDDDDSKWQSVDTRGSLQAAIVLANNTAEPLVAVFITAHQDAAPRYLRDNRDRNKYPICSGQYLINAQESDCF